MSRSKKRDEKLPQFTPLLHYVMDSPAYAALSPVAQCLYLRLKRKCGIGGKKNGEVFYAVREAADDLHVNKNTAGKAFHELQAHGFLVPTQIGSLGITGEAKATTWRMTEFERDRLFLQWRPGSNFPVKMGRSNRREKQNPVPNFQTACMKLSDVRAVDTPEMAAPCMKISDVSGVLGTEPVPKKRTPIDLPQAVGQ